MKTIAQELAPVIEHHKQLATIYDDCLADEPKGTACGKGFIQERRMHRRAVATLKKLSALHTPKSAFA